jgi:hypothetical protein
LPLSLAGWFLAFGNRTFFFSQNIYIYSSVCNILVGIHLSWCVDGLDSGRVLLHPNPVFCQSSHKHMSQPDCHVI